MALKKKYIVYVLLIILIIIYGINAVRQGGDLESYLRASTRIIEDKPLYIDEVVPYIYPPLLAVFLIPLSILPLPVIKVIWFSANIFFIFLSLKLLLNIVGKKDINTFFLGFLSVVFTLRFFLNNSTLGQINVIILYLCVLCLYFFINQKDFYAGLFLSIAVTIKLTPLLLFFYFLYKREFRIILYSIVSMAILFFIPSIVLGFKGNLTALTEYSQLVKNIYDNTYLNQSLYNTVLHVLSPVPLWNNITINIFQLSEIQIRIVTYSLFGIISLLFAYLFRNKISDRSHPAIIFEFSIVLIIMLLFSPVSRKAHFVTLLIPHFIYLFTLLKYKTLPHRTTAFALLIISFVLNTLTVEGIIGSEPSDLMESFSCITVGTMVLLFGLIMQMRSIQKYASPS